MGNFNPEADRRKPTIRIDFDLKKEIQRIAKNNRITECQALAEILNAGLAVYKSQKHDKLRLL